MARPNSYDPQLLPLARTREHLKDEILLSVYLCDKTHAHAHSKGQRLGVHSVLLSYFRRHGWMED